MNINIILNINFFVVFVRYMFSILKLILVKNFLNKTDIKVDKKIIKIVENIGRKLLLKKSLYDMFKILVIKNPTHVSLIIKIIIVIIYDSINDINLFILFKKNKNDTNKHTKVEIFVFLTHKLIDINMHRKYLKNEFLSRSFLLIIYKLRTYNKELINVYNK